MSRTLSKILVICAMIAIFPLMIAGTTLAAYYSIEASILVSAYTNVQPISEDAYAKVVFNGSSESQTEIKVGHKSTVELKATAKGYNFAGWYNGNLENYAADHQAGTVAEKIVSTSAEFSFIAEEYQELLAIFEIVEYNGVSYDYSVQPNGTTSTEVPGTVGATTANYQYGEQLPTLTYTGVDYSFKGWKIAGDATAKIYTHATFEHTQNVVLNAVWEESKHISVSYMNADQTMQYGAPRVVYVGQDHEIEDVFAIVPSAEIQEGYRYSWKDANGNEYTNKITVAEDSEDLTLILSAEEIEYSVNVQSDFGTYTQAVPSFTINDKSTLEELFEAGNWESKYSFWSFLSVSYDGQTYTTANNLANAIVANNQNDVAQPINVTANFKKYFSSYEVTDKIEFKAGEVGDNSYVEDLYLEDEVTTGSEYILGATNGLSTSDIYEVLELGTTQNPVQLYAVVDGIAYEAELTKIAINRYGKTTTISLDTVQEKVGAGNPITFNDIIEAYLELEPTQNMDSIEITSIVAYFEYVI